MKKTIALLILIMMLVTACQPTPETEVVVGKGEDAIEEMVEKIVDSGDQIEEETEQSEETLKLLNYDIPENLVYTQSSDSFGAKITVDVDAEIIIPEYTLPMVEVESRDISYTQINSLVELLAGDETLYFKKYAALINTKTKIQQQIDYYLWEIANCTEEMQSQKSNYEKYVKELYEEMETAPDTYADAVVEGSSEVPVYDSDNNIVGYEEDSFGLTEDMIGPFSFTEDNYNDRAYTLVIGEKYCNDLLVIKALDSEEQQYISYTKGNIYNESSTFTISDLSIMNGYEFTIDNAKEIAQQYVDILDSDLKLFGAGALISREYIVGDTIEWEDAPYGYILVYTRQFNGVNISYTDGEDDLEILSDDDLYAEPYNQEYLSITISKEGVEELEYYCPMTEVETLGAEVELLPFEEIQDIFNEYIVLNGLDSSTEVYVKIDKIQLGLMRIAQPNSDKYLIVPVWDFYGGSISSSSGGALKEGYEDRMTFFYGASYLTINAIDGSIINRELGY